MSIIAMIRYTRGTVRFEIRDGYIERFINLCAQGGVPLWDGRRDGRRYTASTTVKGGRRLAEFAQKAGATLEIQGKKGVPPLLKRYRKRAGLFVGGLVLLAAMGVMGNFIWQIQVSGLETLTREEVLAALDDLGVRQGVWRGSIDARDVERQMMIRLDPVAWIAVNLRGSTAYVEVKERVVPPTRIDDGVPHNVVAAQTGYITAMEVYAGQALVKVGDSVTAGDILVSGIMEDHAGKNRAVHARARVMAQTEEKLDLCIPYRQERYTLKGVVRLRYLTLFGLRIPLSLKTPPQEPYRHESAAYAVPVISRLMPLSYHKDYYFALEQTTAAVPPDEAKETALRELEGMELRELKGREVLSRELQGQEGTDCFLLEARYLCRGDISREVEILTAQAQPMPTPP